MLTVAVLFSSLLKFAEPNLINPACNGGDIITDFVVDGAADLLGDGVTSAIDQVSKTKITNSFKLAENPHKKIEEIFRKHDERVQRKLNRLNRLTNALMKKKNYDKKENLQNLAAELYEYIREVPQLRAVNAKYLRALRYQKSSQEIKNMEQQRSKLGREVGALYDKIYAATETGIHNKLQYNILRIKDILNHEKFIVEIVEDSYYKAEEDGELNQRPELEIPHNIDKLAMPR